MALDEDRFKVEPMPRDIKVYREKMWAKTSGIELHLMALNSQVKKNTTVRKQFWIMKFLSVPFTLAFFALGSAVTAAHTGGTVITAGGYFGASVGVLVAVLALFKVVLSKSKST